MFPCSGNWETSNGHDLAGIYELYNYALGNVSLSGPTYFAPLIRFLNQRVATEKQQNPNNYHVILMLTDGAINDEQETRDAIVEASDLPMSIIIIGVGSADFSAMDRLDSDDGVGFCSFQLLWGTYAQAKRDIVQFVPFNKFNNNLPALAAAVLQELPDQVCQYYRMKGIKPGNVQKEA